MAHQEDCLGLCFHAPGWVWEAPGMSWGDILGQVHPSILSAATAGQGFETGFLTNTTWWKRIKLFLNGLIKSWIICETCQRWEKKKLKPNCICYAFSTSILFSLSGQGVAEGSGVGSRVCILHTGADRMWRLLSSEPGWKKQAMPFERIWGTEQLSECAGEIENEKAGFGRAERKGKPVYIMRTTWSNSWRWQSFSTLFGDDQWPLCCERRGGVGNEEGAAHTAGLGETLRCQAKDFGL